MGRKAGLAGPHPVFADDGLEDFVVGGPWATNALPSERSRSNEMSSVFRRGEPLELFEPVENDVYFWGSALAGRPHHQEAAVGSHVIVPVVATHLEATFEENL